MEVHARLLLQWNKRFGLTAVRSPGEIVRRHFAEPLLALGPLGDRRILLDLGTGGGFPGLPLHVSRALGTDRAREIGQRENHKLILVDRSRNKTAFLETVVARLGIAGVRVIERNVRRARDLNDLTPVDAVALRAVGDPSRKVAWLPELLSPGGVALFFLGEVGCDAAEAAAKQSGLLVDRRVRVPGTEASFLLILQAQAT